LRRQSQTFMAWRNYVSMKQHARLSITKILLKKAFGHWKLLVINAKINAQRLALASNFHDRSVLQKHFRALVAHATARRKLFDYLVRWKLYHNQRLHKKHNATTAISHRSRTLLANSMHHLRLVFKLRTFLSKKCSRTLFSAFTLWRTAFERAQSRGTAAAMHATRAYTLKLLARSFYAWRGVINAHPRSTLLSLRVVELKKRKDTKTTRRIFQNWIQLVRKKNPSHSPMFPHNKAQQ